MIFKFGGIEVPSFRLHNVFREIETPSGFNAGRGRAGALVRYHQDVKLRFGLRFRRTSQRPYRRPRRRAAGSPRLCPSGARSGFHVTQISAPSSRTVGIVTVQRETKPVRPHRPNRSGLIDPQQEDFRLRLDAVQVVPQARENEIDPPAWPRR
jgi:hypothetical protein